MVLTRVEQSLLMAAFFRGNPPDQDLWTSSCDQVVTLSLFYTGDITFAECQRRFSTKSYVAALYDDEVELTPEIRSRYAELIQFITRYPELIQGGGNLETPADPTFTACRLTAAGDELIPAILPKFPAKPDFPHWPDKRRVDQPNA